MKKKGIKMKLIKIKIMNQLKISKEKSNFLKNIILIIKVFILINI